MRERMKDKNKWKKAIYYPAVSLLSLAAATGLGWIFRRYGFQDTNIVLLYLLAVLITTRMTRGYLAGIFTSIAATLAFNYFFTDPYFTFKVNNPDYPFTFVIMTLAAIVTSTLTSRVKQSEENAKEKERETLALYQFTSRLTEAENMEDIAKTVVRSVSNWYGCRAACLCYGEKGEPEPVYYQQNGEGRIVQRKVQDPKLARRMKNLRKPWEEGEEFYDWPIYSGKEILGIIRIPQETADCFQEPQRRLLYSLMECTALAMARARSWKEQMKSRQEAVQERYRGNLLRAISHDLRTPLSGIMGTSEMIMDMSKTQDPRYELAKEINEDTHWLHALVENILSLTKLQEGGVKLTMEMEAAEEIIGGAVRQIEIRASGYEINVKLPEEVLMVPMEGRLIMQVLTNLLDNAVKHSLPDQEITVSLEKDQNHGVAVFTVADRGEGITAEDLPNIFQLFYTSRMKPADGKKGIGLGLSICDSIIKAHGGTITGRNRTDGPGAVFSFRLPLTQKEEEKEVEPIS